MNDFNLQTLSLFQYGNNSFTKLIICVRLHVSKLPICGTLIVTLLLNFKAEVKTGECIFWKEKKGNSFLAFTLQRLLYPESNGNILNDNFNMIQFPKLWRNIYDNRINTRRKCQKNIANSSKNIFLSCGLVFFSTLMFF